MTVAHCQINVQTSHNLLYHAIQYDIVVQKRITHLFKNRSLNAIRGIIPAHHAVQYDIVVRKRITHVFKNRSLNARDNGYHSGTKWLFVMKQILIEPEFAK